MFPRPVQAETRVALVLGNATYSGRPLANPVNDADLVARTLRTLGFEVVSLSDADQPTMKRAILDFGRRLRATDSVGVFYYAGHGVQVDGENYLIPVGSDIRDREEVAISGVNLTEILKTMERASSRLNLAILDACRDNPFPASARSLGQGLAPVNAPSGTLIAYATAPGHVALDGREDNSPYTAALVEAMQTEGIPLEEVFRRARRNVLKATNGRQTPWEHSSLTGEFYFKPKVAKPEASARDESGNTADALRLAELTNWEKIRRNSDAQSFQRHLELYPDGLFRELAEFRLASAAQRTVAHAPWDATVSTTSSITPAPLEVRSIAVDAYESAVTLDTAKAGAGDLARSFTLYRQAAEAGLPAAMYQVARGYDKGRGIPRDLVTAAQWYERAADHQHAGAMAALGTMYEFGEGVPKDLAEAVRLYRLAAENGDVHGLTALAYLHAEGKGVARNPVEARRLYTLAAEKGHPRAMYNLALLHLKGAGGPRDIAQTVGWLKSASEKGHTSAKRELAVLYDEGRGVARSPGKAADLLLAAYRSGDAQARVDIQRRPDAWSFATRRQMQRLLAARGLYSGPAHGLFDARTRQALDRYVQ